MFGGPPPRAERGEVRYLILGALEEQARHGYEIIQAIEERSGGAYRPSPGTVYPTLQMLEELGQVRAAEQDGRKVYELTDAGREELEAHRTEVEDAYERFADSADWPDWHEAGFHELWHRVHRLVRNVATALRRGSLSPRKLRDIQQVIAEAADRIEDILRKR